jgi:hypothetical protein
MDHADYARATSHHLTELGDATADLQKIVDAGLRIPVGCYLLTGMLWLPDDYGEHAGSRGAGTSTFTHADDTRAACRACGTVRSWLAPDCSSLHTGVTLRCGQCAGYASHDELPGRDLTRVGRWERSRVLMSGQPPVGVA